MLRSKELPVRRNILPTVLSSQIESIGVNYGLSVRRTVFSIPEDKFKTWRTFGGQVAVLENIWRTSQF